MPVNYLLSQIFSEIALYLEMEDVPFKPQAYEKAAFVIEGLPEDIEDIYKKKGEKAIKEIPGVGKSIADKIIEYLKTGKIEYYEHYKKKTPVDIFELTSVEGVGPKMVRDLWKYLKVKNLKDLGKAASLGKIRNLPNFGEKTEQNILESIAFLQKSTGRFLLGEIWPTIRRIEAILKTLKEVDQIAIAGSVRRRRETIGDVDLLVTASGKDEHKSIEKIMDFFVSLPGVARVWGKGSTKSSIRMTQGFDVDLRAVSKKSFGSALQYFTGSKDHNIRTRIMAIDKGMKLNEYGVFSAPSYKKKEGKMVAGWTEESIYKAIGIPWIDPELRENRGEIEAALRQAQGKFPALPSIIGYGDLKGDLHCHSNWDGGKHSIEDLAKQAIKMGYEYVGISDHTKFLQIEKGLNEKQLEKRNKEIDKINKQLITDNKRLRILKGCEANIMEDGKIDIDNKSLAKQDYVIAGIHSLFKMPRDKMTQRIINAMKNPNVDIISHPTGRILKKRDEYKIDFDKILKVAKSTGTILEINAWPDRLDLNDINIKKAKEAGVKMIINTDAHHKEQMSFMEYGISQARRGWAEKEDIINTRPLGKLLNFF
jgi:DNA polymerase (family 10)